MKLLSLILGFFTSLLGIGCSRPSSAPPAGADAMRELRIMMIATQPSKAGIMPSDDFPKVFGVVIDFPLGSGNIGTVVSMCDGHASLYTTSTFGIMGGIGHESVRNASIAFVKKAQRAYDEGAPVTEYPYPSTGKVRFYLLGFNGVRVLESNLEMLERGNDERLDLWVAAQDVLTQLRLVTEKKIANP